MNNKKVMFLIDKCAAGEADYKKVIIDELSRDKNELISFLIEADEFYFMYVIQFLDEIILNVYSKDFINEFKEKVFKKYNMLSNININNCKTNYDKCND